jgi:myosin heavy subunit
VEHYAGSVTYDAKSFPSKNKDTLFVSLVMCMQESASSFVHGLFPGSYLIASRTHAHARTLAYLVLW